MKSRAESKREQGQMLNEIFHTSTPNTMLADRMHRLENRAHRLAEDYCNGVIEAERYDKKAQQILREVDALLHFKYRDIPVFINGDPRGYALKIREDYVREHQLHIHRDWGEYGILAPEY